MASPHTQINSAVKHSWWSHRVMGSWYISFPKQGVRRRWNFKMSSFNLFCSYREEISWKSRWSLWRRPRTRKTQKLRQTTKQTRPRKRRWNAKSNAHAVRWWGTSGKESKDWRRLMRRWRLFYRDWNLFMFLLIDPFCSTVQSFTTFFSQYSSGFLSS